jgi:hypothetical protein
MYNWMQIDIINTFSVSFCWSISRHVIKNIKANVYKASKLKSCTILKEWLSSIVNMLWWSLSTANGWYKVSYYYYHSFLYFSRFCRTGKTESSLYNPPHIRVTQLPIIQLVPKVCPWYPGAEQGMDTWRYISILFEIWSRWHILHLKVLWHSASWGKLSVGRRTRTCQTWPSWLVCYTTRPCI